MPDIRTIAAAIMLAAAAACMMLLQGQGIGGVAKACVAASVCMGLTMVPTIWIAAALLLFIPFHQLVSNLLVPHGTDPHQLGAPWEVLVIAGILRSLTVPGRRNILVANLPVLIWAGCLLLAYGISYLMTAPPPAIYALSLGIRFLGVLLFFMLLPVDSAQTTKLIRLMMWSIGLLALYGVIQYFWDYQRLLPLLDASLKDGFANEGMRRVYSYSLNVFEPAFTALVGLLTILSRTVRIKPVMALGVSATLVTCLLLTYTRSAYIGLFAGVIVLSILDRAIRRYAYIAAFVAPLLICISLLMVGQARKSSGLAARVQSIASHRDASSQGHIASMRRAIRDVASSPLGIGLGKSGAAQARFVDAGRAYYIEDWVLNVADEAGIFAAFSYVGLTFVILWTLIRRRHDAVNPWLVRGAVSIFVSLTVVSIMIQVWTCEATLVYAWAIVGLALASSSLKGSDERQTRELENFAILQN
jgi:hypothetical protein